MATHTQLSWGRMRNAMAASSTPWMMNISDLLESENGIGPPRRYVLERVNGELVFRESEFDAIVDEQSTGYLVFSRLQVAALSSCRRSGSFRTTSESIGASLSKTSVSTISHSIKLSVRLDAGVCFLARKASAIIGFMNRNSKRSLALVLAEFRKGIAHHRAKGATEERIRQLLSASIQLAVREVHDAELCAWLCDEFSKAASVAPIPNSHPLSQTLH